MRGAYTPQAPRGSMNQPDNPLQALGTGGALAVVGPNDLGDQRVADDVDVGEVGKGDALDVGEDPPGVAQA